MASQVMAGMGQINLVNNDSKQFNNTILQWCIRNLLSPSAYFIGSRLYSNPFLLPGFGSSTLVLTLSFIENGYAEIGIEGLPSSYFGKIKVYIENSNGAKFFTNYTGRATNFLITQYAKTDVLLRSQNILSGTDLKMIFEIEKTMVEELGENNYKFQALDRFETLLDNQEFADIKFVVNDKTIYANKLILVSGSSVFSAMFKKQKKEARENIVVVKDMQYEVLMETLRFIYTEKVNQIEKFAEELLAAADKYDLQGLKEMCTIHLCKNMSVDNVIEYLHSADLHNVQQLRKKAIDFIILNGKMIVKRPDFNSLLKLHEDLVLEIVRSALSQERI